MGGGGIRIFYADNLNTTYIFLGIIKCFRLYCIFTLLAQITALTSLSKYTAVRNEAAHTPHFVPLAGT